MLINKVLDYLKARPNTVITFKELYEAIWLVPAYPGYLNILRVTICNARDFLQSGSSIHNVFNVGYIYKKGE